MQPIEMYSGAKTYRRLVIAYIQIDADDIKLVLRIKQTKWIIAN